MKLRNVAFRWAVGTTLLACLGSSVLSEDTSSGTEMLISLTDGSSNSNASNKASGLILATTEEPAGSFRLAATADEAKWTKPIPLTFSIDYTLVSDYVWRGQNLSEYAGEGREKPNHQMGIGVSYDSKSFGTFSGSVWFEWFAGQGSLDPASSGNLQETDYALSWSYDIDALATTVELGWLGYQFPQASGDGKFTHEWYVSLSFDDSQLFKTKESVLNPYVAYYMDVDDIRGSWIEWGVSHDFALAECGMKNTPALKDITVTPSFVMGIDHGQISGSTKLAHLQYGLDVAYDLSSALGIPEKFGDLALTGFLCYSDAVYDKAINDEFWGGVTLGYSW